MKPLLTVLTLLTSSTCIWADPIDPEKAREIAQAYMCGNQIPETVETLVNKRNSTDGYAPLYISTGETTKALSSYPETTVCLTS